MNQAIRDWYDDKGTFPGKMFLAKSYFAEKGLTPGRSIPGTYSGKPYVIQLLLDDSLKGSQFRLE